MHTYPMNTNYEAIETAVAKLTTKGRAFMTAVGKCELSFFDDGIVEHSGSWGEILAGDYGFETPRSAAGVMGGTKKLGLWTTGEADGAHESGLWWMLTALGADVANFLAGTLQTQADAEQQMATAEPTVKKGRKWSYIYAADGSLIAEVRNDMLDAIWKTVKYDLA